MNSSMLEKDERYVRNLFRLKKKKWMKTVKDFSF